MKRVIAIVDSNAETQELVLQYEGKDGKKPGSDIEAYPLDKIVWELRDPKVYSYRIEPKEDSNNIWHFWNGPPKNQTRDKTETAGVGFFAKNKKFKYSIIWKVSADGPDLVYDPIIAIQPRGFLWLFGNSLPIIAFTSFMKWRMDRMGKNNLHSSRQTE